MLVVPGQSPLHFLQPSQKGKERLSVRLVLCLSGVSKEPPLFLFPFYLRPANPLDPADAADIFCQLTTTMHHLSSYPPKGNALSLGLSGDVKTW